MPRHRRHRQPGSACYRAADHQGAVQANSEHHRRPRRPENSLEPWRTAAQNSACSLRSAPIQLTRSTLSGLDRISDSSKAPSSSTGSLSTTTTSTRNGNAYSPSAAFTPSTVTVAVPDNDSGRLGAGALPSLSDLCYSGRFTVVHLSRHSDVAVEGSTPAAGSSYCHLSKRETTPSLLSDQSSGRACSGKSPK